MKPAQLLSRFRSRFRPNSAEQKDPAERRRSDADDLGGQAEFADRTADLVFVNRVHDDHHVRLEVAQSLRRDDLVPGPGHVLAVLARADVDHPGQGVGGLDGIEEGNAFRPRAPNDRPTPCKPAI